MTMSPYSAPRFWAYFQKLEGRPMFLMLRSQWDVLKLQPGERVSVEVSDTPMARLVTAAEIAGAVAERKSDYEATIAIYRRDPKDAAHAAPINVDRYLVWERLPDHRDLFTMVNAASTSDNANMRGFLADYVFLVKDGPGSDHWLPEVPIEIRAVIEERKVR
jgi:hypothetical protein